MTESIPQKQCRTCKQFKPATAEFFHRNPTGAGGFIRECKQCRNASLRKPPKPIVEDIVPQGMKRCRSCKQCKPATTEFFNATAISQSPDGLNKQCKQCRKVYRSALNKAEPKTPRPQSDSKQCQVCKESFPATLDYFHYNKATKDRLCTRCIECSKTKSKEYRVRPGGLEERRRYRAMRAESDREYHRLYREIHKEYVLEYHRLYHEAHKEHERNYRNQYRQRPYVKLQMNARYHKRRARKLGNGGTYAAQDIQRIYEAQRGRCYYCRAKFGNGKYAYHIDHVIPLSRGGSNGSDNIVIACPLCNLSKGDKLLHEWLRGGRLL